MRVFFDSQIISLQRNGGISGLFKGLVKEFCHNPKLKVTPVLQSQWVRHLTPFEIANAEIVNFAPSLRKVDLQHRTYYLPSALRAAPVVTTLHDKMHEKGMSKNSRFWSLLKAHNIRIADGIIFASRKTASEYGEMVSGKKVLGTITPFSKFANSLISPARREDFFLYIGPRRGYKSFETLVDAMKIETSAKVVCVGGEKPGGIEVDFVVQGRLERMTNVTDSQLLKLFNTCKALVSTSLEEGFGMTLLEAASVGCPTIATDIPAHHEANPNAFFYAPKKSTQLADLLRLFSKSHLSVRDPSRIRSVRDYAREHKLFYELTLSGIRPECGS